MVEKEEICTPNRVPIMSPLGTKKNEFLILNNKI